MSVRQATAAGTGMHGHLLATGAPPCSGVAPVAGHAGAVVGEVHDGRHRGRSGARVRASCHQLVMSGGGNPSRLVTDRRSMWLVVDRAVMPDGMSLTGLPPQRGIAAIEIYQSMNGRRHRPRRRARTAASQRVIPYTR